MGSFVHSKENGLAALMLLLLSSLSMVSANFFLEPPILDPNDPLENTGPNSVTKQVTQIELQDTTNTLNAELFIPATQGGGETEMHGFVLFMPGFGTSFEAYDDLLKHLASHGYLTVGLDFDGATFTTESEHDVKARQALEAISYIQNLNPTKYGSLPVISAGHSQGGKLAFYATAMNSEAGGDTNIAAVMAMDPVNSGGPPCFLFPNQCRKYPVAPNVESGQRGVLYQIRDGTSSLIFRSAPDLTNPDEQFNAQYFYYGSDKQGTDATPSPAFYFDMGSFGHGSYVPLFCSEEVQIVKRSMVAFLQQSIQNIDRSDYLTGNIIEADVQSGYIFNVESR